MTDTNSIRETRPTTFNDYVGQEQGKAILNILTKSALKKGTPVCHTLLNGRPGLGKTTLCRIIANEMGSKLIEVVASNIQDPQQLNVQLVSLEANDILFIDEIHSLPRAVEEVLYSAMEERTISIVCETDYGDLMKSLGMGSSKKSRTLTYELPPFTVFGATTLLGSVSAPLRSRFVQTINLVPYDISELAQIVQNAASKMKFKLSHSVAVEIAKRSRGTARIAIGNLHWIMEYSTASESSATLQTVSDAFLMKGIDANGLTKLDHDYLSILVAAKHSVGLSSIAASLGESEKTISDSIEPYLMQEGYIRRVSKGRIAEQKAFNLIQIKRKAA